MTYWRLHYHLIWSTFERQPVLTLEREKIFYGVLYDKGNQFNAIIHAAGNVADHVHIVASIPPKISVANFMKHIKGTSAFAINHAPGNTAEFKWQEGYAALSVGERSLDTVMAYAANQKEHHKNQTIITCYEILDEEKETLKGVRAEDDLHRG